MDDLRGEPDDDRRLRGHPMELPPASRLSKVAGQTCYASFGPKRTYNDDAAKYFANQRSGGHDLF